MTQLNFPGSRWWKFDFHTHTPVGSDDYQGDKSISPQAWLQAHKSRGMDCVVVTDHNSGQWLDDLKKSLETLKQQDLAWLPFYILPGVEISCSGGVHVLAVLDCDKTSQDIAALVGACGYHGTLGRSDAVTDQSVSNVIDTIHAKGGIAIAAHVDMDKGLFCAVKDATTLRQVLEKVDALQVVDESRSTSSVSDQNCKNLISKLASIQGSDNHNAAEMAPEAFTWVKLTTPSLQGLKLALAEPTLSIVRSDLAPDTPQNLPRHWIRDLSIEGLDKRRAPMAIKFNPWLNTIIGGRGSGKSSLVECLRLGLGRGDEAEEMLGKEHEVSKAIHKFCQGSQGMVLPTTKLKATVSGAGEIGGVYRYDWSATGHSVKRPLPSWFTSNEDADQNWEDTGIQASAIPADFPVRIFSQKQIHALANRPNGLLSYFDSPGKGNKAVIQTELSQLRAAFMRDRAKVRHLRHELQDWPHVKDQLAQVNESLTAYARQGVNEKLLTLQKIRAEKRALTDFREGLQVEIRDALSGIGTPDIEDWQIELPEGSSEQARELVEKWHAERDALRADWQKLEALTRAIQARTDAMTASPEYTRWNTQASGVEASCLQALEQVKTQLGGQLQQVGILQQNKERLEQQSKLHEASSQKLTEAIAQAQKAYQALCEARKKITESRQKFVNEVIGDPGKAILKITIQHAAQFDESAKEDLRKLLGFNTADYANAFLGDLEDEISLGIVPALRDKPGQLAELKKTLQCIVDTPNSPPAFVLNTPIGGALIRGAMRKLTDEQLDPIWDWFPEDRVEIQFRTTPQDKWQDISKGSAGQQTGALLSFILNEGDEPLILDQPEDDLDNAMVYDLVVQQLRANKSRRQVIVVTHNANIVVNGDAELVVPMAFRGGQIQSDPANGLQDLGIRKTICDVMEGGQKAFEKRYERVLRHIRK